MSLQIVQESIGALWSSLGGGIAPLPPTCGLLQRFCISTFADVSSLDFILVAALVLNVSVPTTFLCVSSVLENKEYMINCLRFDCKMTNLLNVAGLIPLIFQVSHLGRTYVYLLVSLAACDSGPWNRALFFSVNEKSRGGSPGLVRWLCSVTRVPGSFRLSAPPSSVSGIYMLLVPRWILHVPSKKYNEGRRGPFLRRA